MPDNAHGCAQMIACRCCKAIKTESEYHRSARDKSGRKTICKICAAKAGKEYKKTNGNNASLEARARTLRNWRHNNPEKATAHEKVHYAIKKGRIIKSECEICGEVKAHAHHDDYSKPLEVRWLCRTHHNEFHNQYVEAKA